jgi:hypothetical protein
MKLSRTLVSPTARGLVAAAFVTLLALAASTARADMAEGKLTQDLTVGANNDIPLKTGQVVQIMNQKSAKTVIMVPLADGSNGIFQIDSAKIQSVPAGTPLGMPAPPKPPPPPPGSTPPSYPAGFAGVPTFQTTQGNHGAGVASLVKLSSGDQAYILTARQLLGPHGGFDAQIAAADVTAVVHDVQLAPFAGGNALYAVTGLAVHTSRLQADNGKPVDDLAILKLQDATAQAQAVPLADQAPAVGDVVWVIAKLHAPTDQLAHRGQITAIGKWTEMQFDDDNILTAGSTGAPVLNSAGQVVGILSTTVSGGGNMRAEIIPASVIVQAIPKQKH